LSYVRDGDLYAMDLAGNHEIRLTDDASPTLKNGLPDFLAAEEMHRFQGHWWSTGDNYLAYTKVDEAPVRVSYRLEMQADGAATIEQRYPYAGEINPRVELWVHNLQTAMATCVWSSDETADAKADAYLARVHMAEDRLIVQTQDRLQQHLRLKSYDLQTGSWRDLHTEESNTWINLTDDFRFLELERMLITSERTGTRQAYTLDQAGNLSPLAGPHHITKVHAITQTHAYVSGWTSTPCESHLFAVALDGEAVHQVTQAPGVHNVVFDEPGLRYIDQFSDERTPSIITLRDLTDANADVELYRNTIGDEHPYAPYLPLHAYPTFGEVRASDGKALHYRLTPPAQIHGTHPTIVYVYGGPGPQMALREWSPMLVQLFAHHGFAVLEVDNRGSGHRGQEFEAPIYRRMGGVEIEDQVAGLEVLRDHSWADPQKVGVYGHSYGGYMTLMCLSQAPDRFQAGVAVAPVCDWALYDTHYTERYMGLPEDNQAGYEQANVLTHLHHLKSPLLLMHGMADDNVLFTHSTKIMGRLQSLGTPFELMTYPGAKHSMQERDVSIHRFNMILDFFKRHLA
jgi:dipeptidyl-peptidase-4